ncbi:MAG: hypothetical protein AB7D05_09800 [Mangrovibacterium sp.]
MNKINYLLSAVLSLLLAMACSTQIQQLKSRDQVTNPVQLDLIDSILQKGLDNEALYSLLGDIKPMSSLVTFGFPIANTDSTKASDANILNREIHGQYLDRLETIQQAVNQIDLPGLKVIMIPYRSTYGKRRLIQLSVVRISALDKLLREKERTGKFVERNAFRIPTFSMPDMGNFVYTYPKDYVPSASIDSVIYYKGVKILENYRAIRNSYLNADSTLQAYKLIREYSQD